MTNEELAKYVSNQIKQMRERRGLTQQELAERLNTTKQTVSRYESGQRKANQDVLFELSHVLNCSINDFFPHEEEDHSAAEVVAAHIDDDVTEEELEEILEYIKYRKQRRKK